MKIIIPTVDQVIALNNYLCEEQGNPFQVLEKGKIASALHTAFYPGSYPFSAGGVAKIAGALCFYLVKAHAFIDGNKRTGTLTAINFMNLNGWDLNYPNEEENGSTALANIIEKCAASDFSKDDLIEWFDQHKIWHQLHFPNLDSMKDKSIQKQVAIGPKVQDFCKLMKLQQEDMGATLEQDLDQKEKTMDLPHSIRFICHLNQ